LNSENFQPQQEEMQGKAELSRPGNIQFSNPWPAKIFQLSLATATKVAKVYPSVCSPQLHCRPFKQPNKLNKERRTENRCRKSTKIEKDGSTKTGRKEVILKDFNTFSNLEEKSK